MKLPVDEFERSVFVNCPFDAEYAPILQGLLFTLIQAGFLPRIALEAPDSGTVRVQRICAMIETSRLSIHDLSRCQASAAGEYYRLNMPFELGVDYGCRMFSTDHRALKRMLILEEEQYRYQATLSDFAGCDIEKHDGDVVVAVRKVRNWLASGGANIPPAARIMANYEDFQQWHYDSQLIAGFSDDDIRDYPTAELLTAMTQWFELGMPLDPK
jgi:hypothetical protein